MFANKHTLFCTRTSANKHIKVWNPPFSAKDAAQRFYFGTFRFSLPTHIAQCIVSMKRIFPAFLLYTPKSLLIEDTKEWRNKAVGILIWVFEGERGLNVEWFTQAGRLIPRSWPFKWNLLFFPCVYVWLPHSSSSGFRLQESSEQKQRLFQRQPQQVKIKCFYCPIWKAPAAKLSGAAQGEVLEAALQSVMVYFKLWKRLRTYTWGTKNGTINWIIEITNIKKCWLQHSI